MFADEAKLDDRDIFLHSHIGRWVLLKWRDDLFMPPQYQAYGSHLATFILCPHGSEIRGWKFCWLYSSDEGQVFRVGEPLTGINATWSFKYSTLKEFNSRPLSTQEIDFLGLPDFDKELHSDIAPSITAIRNDPRLHSFRHPGYPDDIHAICGESFIPPSPTPEIRGEQVWVRLTGKENQNRFTGFLLNQPMFYGWLKGETVVVQLIETNNKSILVCAKDQ